MKKIILSAVLVGVIVLGGISGANKFEVAKKDPGTGGLSVEKELAKKDPGTGGLRAVVAKKDPGTGGL